MLDNLRCVVLIMLYIFLIRRMYYLFVSYKISNSGDEDCLEGRGF